MQIEVPVTVYVATLGRRQPPEAVRDTLHEFVGVAASAAGARDLIINAFGLDPSRVGPLAQCSDTQATVAIDEDRAGFIYKVAL